MTAPRALEKRRQRHDRSGVRGRGGAPDCRAYRSAATDLPIRCGKSCGDFASRAGP
jgi:hypothetical protein